MKKKIAVILFVLTCIVFAFDLFCLIYGIVDINNTLDRLKAEGASGIDYWGLGWGMGISLVAVSVVGLILTLITKKIAEINVLKSILSVLTAVFLLLLAAGFIVFFM